MKGTKGHEELQLQQQMIEKAPGFEIGAMISQSGSLFNHFAVAVHVRRTEASMPAGSFSPFVPFMSFLFRLLESLTTSGAQNAARNVSVVVRPGRIVALSGAPR
jgi:hypothetical protein